MARFFTYTLVVALAALMGCSARLLLDGDLHADSDRQHPNPVSVVLPAGD